MTTQSPRGSLAGSPLKTGVFMPTSMRGNAIDDDLRCLAGQAYHRLDWGRPLIERYYALVDEGASLPEAVDLLRRWFLVPITLWPVHVGQLLDNALEQLAEGRGLDESLLLATRLLPEFPGEAAMVARRAKLDLPKVREGPEATAPGVERRYHAA